MTVRAWWDNAREQDQVAVLRRLGRSCGLKGIPWAFLPDEVQDVLNHRVHIRDEQLAGDWRRTCQE